MPCDFTGEKNRNEHKNIYVNDLSVKSKKKSSFLSPRVEFQNKFYSGTGYKLNPFAFASLICFSSTNWWFILRKVLTQTFQPYCLIYPCHLWGCLWWRSSFFQISLHGGAGFNFNVQLKLVLGILIAVIVASPLMIKIKSFCYGTRSSTWCIPQISFRENETKM